MRVFVTGATGLIGGALCRRLAAESHELTAWVRSPAHARRRLPEGTELLATNAPPKELDRALASCDGVVNLAGESVLGGRWTASRRAALVASRVGLTDELVAAIGRVRAAGAAGPHVLVSGSAVGYYGDGGAAPLGEDAPPGADFLARLCVDWEASARRAEAHGLRVVTVRTGVVLAPRGGALAQMLPPFRLGVGGPVGSGRQYMAWVHLDDEVGVLTAALTDERYRGAFNLTAPDPVTSKDFARALGRALHRPAVLPVPSLALRLIFGDAAQVLLTGQRAEPRRLREVGYAFRFPELPAALADVVAG